MDSYTLFKQLVAAILFFEQLVLWPRFSLYFGNLINFSIVVLGALAMIFFDWHPVVGSLIAFVAMRILYTDRYGAVGHLCYLTTAYLFFLEVGRVIGLFSFIYTVFAIEVGIILVSAVLYKLRYGYLKGDGYEYALVNPNWGKLYFWFNKLHPRSFIFTLLNWSALVGELGAGLCLWIPALRGLGGALLILLFAFAFLTVRANVLPLLMIAIGLLFLGGGGSSPPPEIVLPEPLLWAIRGIFILYLAVYVLTTLLAVWKPAWLSGPFKWFMKARPFFVWDVFTSRLTDYFVKIEKNNEVIYDGHPAPFSRFIHHHESSILLYLFSPLRLYSKSPDIEKLTRYGKTFVKPGDPPGTEVVFTLIRIGKGPHQFIYVPVGSFTVCVVK